MNQVASSEPQQAVTASQIVEVPFDGDVLTAVREGDDVWIVVKRVCEALGVDFKAQHRRLKVSPWAGIAIMATPDPRGRAQRTLCIPLKRMSMWLATIDAGRVAEHVRPKIERYQVEAADALHAYFFGGSGQLDPQLADEVHALRETVTALRRELIATRAELAVLGSGEISRGAFAYMKRLVREIVGLEVETRRLRTRRSAFSDVYRELRETFGWGGKRQPWKKLPAALVQHVLVALECRKAAAQRQLNILATDRQLRLPYGTAVRNGLRVLS